MKRVLRHPETLALPISLLAILGIIFFLLVELALGHKEALQSTEKDLRHSSIMLAEHVGRSSTGIAILLQEIANDLSLYRSDWQSWTDPQGHSYLSRRQTRALPQLRDLIIFDQTGQQRFISSQTPSLSVNISDRPYFLKMKEGTENAFFGPYIRRNTGQYSYALARRLTLPDQSFGGIVFAALDGNFFHEFCWPIRVHDDIDAFLINSNGKIISSCRPVDTSALSPIINQPVTKILGISSFEIGAKNNRSAGRIFAVSPVQNFPELMVISSLTEEAALANWRKKALEFICFALAIIAVLLSAGWLLKRQLKQLAITSTELEYHRQHLEECVRKATAELAAEKEEAERTSLAKSRFLAAASHDLRQPLHALSLFTSDLQRQIRSGLTRDLDPLAGQINLSVLSLKDLFDSLLDISRLDMGRIEPEPEAFRLQDVFERIHIVFRRAALTKRITLRVRPTSCWINSDVSLTERLLTNLVSNAIRYTPNGGRVLVLARRRQNVVRIEVRDNGPGIDPKDQKIIFNEFFQLGNPERDPQKGIGLGLPIVQRLTLALGGKLDLRSKSGRGAVFAISLPSAEPNPRAPLNDQHPEATLILLADCPELAKIAEMAGAWGYRCKVENNLEEIIRPQSMPPHIVFAPTEKGSQLRAFLPPEWPVILVSSGHIIAGDGVYVLPTPIQPARLRALLQQLQKVLSRSIR